MPAQSFFAHTSMERPVYELSSCQNRKSSRDMQNERIRILFERQKSKFSLKLEPRIRNTNIKPILIEEVSRNWMELLSLSERKLIILFQVMNNSDEINYNFKNYYQNKIGIFVKLIWKVLMRWNSWREFKSYESMNFWKEDWSKIRTLFMNSRPEFRNYRMKSIVWMSLEILRMLSQ